jgi:ketosteroid isomerase-like protein
VSPNKNATRTQEINQGGKSPALIYFRDFLGDIAAFSPNPYYSLQTFRRKFNMSARPNQGEISMCTKLSVLVIAAGLFILPAARPHRSPSQAPAMSATARELTELLNQFLVDAAKNNVAGFDRFFADDVIYTRNTGGVTNKADIIKSVSAARGPRLETTATYSAEDVTIHEYADTAIVNFRLVSDEEHSAGKPPTITKYRNTGTFLRRNGKWQVIAWQSTKIPDPAPAAN